MRIEIHAETEAEKQQLKDPWVKPGVERFMIAGFGTATQPEERPTFGYVHGVWQVIKGDLLQVQHDLDRIQLRDTMVEANILAHNKIVEAQHAQQIGKALRNGHPRLVT